MYAILLILFIGFVTVLILSEAENSIRRSIRDNKLKYGYISRKDLSSLSYEPDLRSRFFMKLLGRGPSLFWLMPYKLIFDDEEEAKFDRFIEWCRSYMESRDYLEGVYVSRGALAKEDNEVEAAGEVREALMKYISGENGESVYLQCILLRQDPQVPAVQEDNWPSISRATVQKFAGAMIKGKVKKGIIITTGNFSEPAVKYVGKLPEQFCIELIDGISITKEHRKVVTMELAKLAENV